MFPVICALSPQRHSNEERVRESESESEITVALWKIHFQRQTAQDSLGATSA